MNSVWLTVKAPMKRYLAVALLALVLIAPAQAQTNSPAYNAVASSATVIMEAQGGIGYCGGVFLSATQVLTAAHCTLGVQKIHVYDAFGNQADVISVRRSVPRDLAILYLGGKGDLSVRPAGLGGGYLGEEVWVVGAPAGEPFVLTHGYVSQIRNMKFENCDEHEALGSQSQQTLYVDARVYSGNSGGGVFDNDGRLLGIIVRMAAVGGSCTVDVPNVTVLWGIAVGSQAIYDFLGGN